jgi:hypothetical protein
MKAATICTAVVLAMLAGTSATRAQDYSAPSYYSVPNAFCPYTGCGGHCLFGHHCAHPGCQPYYGPSGGVAPPFLPMNCGNGQGPPQYPVHPFARSPRDFFMLQP